MMVRLLIIALLLNIVTYAENNVSKKTTQNRQILQMMQSELSKGLPKKIDTYTTLIGVEVENQTLVYIYAINTGAKSDESVRRDDMPRMQRAIIQGECRRSKIHFENGMDIEYRYRNALSHAELFRIHISYDNCREFY